MSQTTWAIAPPSGSFRYGIILVVHSMKPTNETIMEAFMKHFLMTTLLGFMCLSTAVANAEDAAEAKKTITVANRELNYSFLEDRISEKFAAPISIASVEPKLSKTHINIGAKLSYALIGQAIKVYSINLKHDSGVVSTCDMHITERQGDDNSANLITIRIHDCDGFLESETSESGGLVIQEFIK